MLALLAFLIGLAVGALAMRWQSRRPRKPLPEPDRAGMQRYQAFKAGR